MQIGFIYTIECTENNKVYVGLTRRFSERKSLHIMNLSNNRHYNYLLQEDWNKYGEDSFRVEIIDEYQLDLLPAMEHYWSIILNSSAKSGGYNIQTTNPNKYYRYDSRINLDNKKKERKTKPVVARNLETGEIINFRTINQTAMFFDVSAGFVVARLNNVPRKNYYRKTKCDNFKLKYKEVAIG